MSDTPTPIRHPTAQLDALVRAYAASPSAAALCTAAEFAFSHQLGIGGLRAAYESTNKAAIWNLEGANLLGRTLSHCRIVSSNQPQDQHEPSERERAASALLKPLLDAFDAAVRIRQAEDDITKPGFGFLVGFELKVEDLSTPEQEAVYQPALVVSQYLRSMFPAPAESETLQSFELIESSEAAQFASDTLRNDCATALYEAAIACSEDDPLRIQMLACAAVLTPTAHAHLDSQGRPCPKAYFRNLIRVPQGVFDLEVAQWEAGERASFHSTIAVAAFLQLLEVSPSQVRPTHCQDAPQVKHIAPCSSWEQLHQLLELSSSRTLPRDLYLPVLRWRNFASLLETIASDLPRGTDRDASLLNQFAHRIALAFLASDHRLPLPRSALHHIVSSLLCLHDEWGDDPDWTPQWGISLLHALHAHPYACIGVGFCGIFDHAMGLLEAIAEKREMYSRFRPEHSHVLTEARSRLRTIADDDWLEAIAFRRDLYLRLIDACLKAGLREMANALLAYLLQSHFYLAQDSALSPEHASVLDACRGQPGWRMVEITIDLVAPQQSFFDPNPRVESLGLVWLRSWRPNAPAVDGIIALSEDGAQRRLISMVGKEVWISLKGETKQRLIEAERAWDRTYSEAGTSRTHWGPDAQAIATAIETEVLFRMTPVFSSPDFQQYQRKRQRPTLGTVKALFDARDLPDSLMECLRSVPVNLIDPGNRVLFRQFVDLRNRASHAGDFGPEDFVKLRRLLFEQRLITALFGSPP